MDATKVDRLAAIREPEAADNDVTRAMLSLARKGKITPTGEKRNGHFVWIAIPDKPAH